MLIHFVPQLVPVSPGQPSGGLNCQCAVAAMAVAHATGGRHKPTAEQVRMRCLEKNGAPDKSGGTSLRQVDEAINRGWGVDLDVRTPWQYAEMRTHAQRNPDCVYSISIWYGVLRGTPAYASLAGFVENHQILARWNGEPGKEWEVYDPLADGRSSRVPEAPVYVSDAVMRRAAGELALRTDPRTGRVLERLGLGRVYVGIARAPKVVPKPVKYSVTFAGGRAFWVYDGGDRVSKRLTKDSSAPCLAPARFVFRGTAKRMVVVTAGLLKGKSVEVGRDGVMLKETT